MKRIKRGWTLTKKSWGLLNENRELLRFPLYGAVATIPLAIVFLGPGLYLVADDVLAGGIPLLVIGVFVLSVVGFYFSVGLAAAADKIFRGEQATVGDGLAVARERFTQILGWAAVSTAISVLMGVLEEYDLAADLQGPERDLRRSPLPLRARRRGRRRLHPRGARVRRQDQGRRPQRPTHRHPRHGLSAESAFAVA